MINPAQGMTPQQLTSMGNQMLAQQQQQATQRHMKPYNLYNWVWDGQPCTLIEFAELAFGDTPERTAFLLKYTKEK